MPALQYKWMQAEETAFEGKGLLEDRNYKDVGLGLENSNQVLGDSKDKESKQISTLNQNV